MNPLITNLIANVVIPEAIAFIREYVRQRNGQWPTEAEVMAGLPRLADMYVAQGEDFLNRNNPTPAVAESKPKKKRSRKTKTTK